MIMVSAILVERGAGTPRRKEVSVFVEYDVDAEAEMLSEGLLGSQAVAQDYQKRSVPVYAQIQVRE